MVINLVVFSIALCDEFHIFIVTVCCRRRLDNEMQVKVADFGLSRDIYERDYYSSDNRKSKLPVKWMALESLEKGIYNSKTDVVRVAPWLYLLLSRSSCSRCMIAY